MKNQMKSLSKLIAGVAVGSVLFTSCQKQPEASFTTDKNEYIAGETIKLMNTSTDAASYKWTFPDGTTGTVANYDYVTNATTPEGTLTFKLEAFSKNGKKDDETTNTVNIKAAMGEVSFWNKLASDYPMVVTINGNSANIIKSYASAPSDCKQPGNANFNLKAGTYSYSAIDEFGTTWSGNVTITKDGCLTIELVD